MIRASKIVYELILIASALSIGRIWSNELVVIPDAIITLPGQTLSLDNLISTLSVFLPLNAILLTIFSLTVGTMTFGDPRRVAAELYIILFGFIVSASCVFLATSTPFSPAFILASGIILFFLILVSFLVSVAIKTSSLSAAIIGSALSGFAIETARTAKSWWAVIILVMALSPIVLMVLYVSNRDVANMVTRVRLSLTQENYQGWALVDAIPGLYFRQPMMIQFSPIDDNIAYVLERHGRLYKVDFNSGSDKTLILDFSEQVGEVDIENGALGFDLHPEFGRSNSPNGGYAYIYYTNVEETGQTNRLSRFNLSNDTLQTRLLSEIYLIEFERAATGYHNGGSVEFGPDSFLYFAIGEASDPETRQRIDRKLYGGIFRIDVDRRGGDISQPIGRQPLESKTQEYYIPVDNPFVGTPNALEEYWALGLRNPFRISFDPETGALWVGDVGSAEFEEINVIDKGANYQYPYIEGVAATNTPKPAQVIGDEKSPIYFYAHTAYDRVVIGGTVYRSDTIPELRNKYIYADGYSGKVMMLEADPDNPGEPIILTRSNQVAQRGITSIVTSPEGSLLLTTLGRSEDSTGRLLKLIPSDTSTTQLADRSDDSAQATTSRELVGDEITAIYNTNCGRCHGVSGRGDGPDSLEMKSPLPDFTDPEFHKRRSDEDIFVVIKEGGESVGLSYEMPPWDLILTEDEMRQIVVFVRNFSQ